MNGSPTTGGSDRPPFTYRDLARSIDELSDAQKDAPVTVLTRVPRNCPGGVTCEFRGDGMWVLDPTSYERLKTPILLTL